MDVVARYGGEEFVILMPETGIESAAQMAERIRLAVENNSIASADACILVTVSLGIAEVDEGTKDFESLLRNADQALYAAKAEGRNRVFAWQAGK